MKQISKEYAEALFMLACEEKKEDEYKLALELVERELKNQPEYLDFLSSPYIQIDERLAALDSAFSSVLPGHVLDFLKLLCEKGRVDCILDSIDEYKYLCDNIKNISTAKVTSAVAMTDAQKTALKQKLEKSSGRNIIFDFHIDETIAGGLIVELDGKIIDASVRHFLKDIKDVISR